MFTSITGERICPMISFFDNALADNFHIPAAKISEFKAVS